MAAYSLVNSCAHLPCRTKMKRWFLTTLREKMVKLVGYRVFQMAEVAGRVTRGLSSFARAISARFELATAVEPRRGGILVLCRGAVRLRRLRQLRACRERDRRLLAPRLE